MKKEVNRVEVIDQTGADPDGHILIKQGNFIVEVSIQDDEQTFKLFISEAK